MRRLFLIPALGALALLVSAVPAPAGRARRPLAKATLVACHHALAPADRYAKFRGDMRSLKRNVRLSISFELLEKTPSSNGYQRVQAPDLGTWSEADQGVGHYVYKKTVLPLDAPASYIGVMHFRWTDANGKITRTATKRTAVCHQPDLRPNLVVGAMTVAPGPRPGTERYRVVTRNVGRRPAGSFDVELTVDGLQQPVQTVSGLPAGDRKAVVFVAPACASGGTVAATLDPDNRVAESNEQDDAKTVACPAA